MRPYLYSVLEQHECGNWWYHRGWTFPIQEEAQYKADQFFSHHQDQPTIVLKHRGCIVFPPCFTTDFRDLYFAGRKICSVTSPSICYSAES